MALLDSTELPGNSFFFSVIIDLWIPKNSIQFIIVIERNGFTSFQSCFITVTNSQNYWNALVNFFSIFLDGVEM